ncbi:hypothetical protein [Henriciella litoralis]|uniref:hypothetical protein n=1 Tax=Henriciella litoralis TaxID=568102 RepID=UPI0009FC91D6|nr:hypothetical protein [Henriciella litoralis]
MAIAFRIVALAALGLSGTAFAQGASDKADEEMPTLSDCLSSVDTGDSDALDACVKANVDEISQFIEANPDGSGDPVDVPSKTSDTDTQTEPAQ